MRACKYSDKESSNAAKQMVVRKAAFKKKKKSPPLSNLHVITGVICVPNYWVVRQSQQEHPIPNPHNTSTPSTPGSRRSPRLKPKPKLTRGNPRAMQKHHVNKLAMSDKH
jgi:hypothetical protein